MKARSANYRNGRRQGRGGGWRARLALVFFAFLGLGTPGWAGPPGKGGAYDIFELVARSEIVASAQVTGTKSFPAGLVVYRLSIGEFIKGGDGQSELALVQDRGPEKRRPRFLEKGQRFLLFASRLPRYSLYERNLPPGQYWQWTEPYPSANRLREVSSEEVPRLVKEYLSLPGGEGKAEVTFVAQQLGSPLDWVRRDSVAKLAREADLVGSLSQAALASMKGYLADERFSAQERARLVSLVEERRLTPLAAVLHDLVQNRSAVAGDALKALGSLGQGFPLASLLEYSRSPEARLRAGAAHALGREGSGEALRRLGEMATEDPQPAVRLASAEALGYSEQATEELERVLTGGDKQVKLRAAESLARIGSDKAVKVLSRRLYRDDTDAAAAAVFALARLKSPAAVDALNQALQTSKNRDVRALIMTLVPGGRQ